MTQTVDACSSEIEAWRDGYDTGRRCSRPTLDPDLDRTTTPPDADIAAAWAAGWKAGYSEGSATGEATAMLAACAAALGITIGGSAWSNMMLPAQAGAARALIQERLAPLVRHHTEQAAAAHAALLAQKHEREQQEAAERQHRDAERGQQQREERQRRDAERAQRRCTQQTLSGEVCRLDSGHNGRCKPLK